MYVAEIHKDVRSSPTSPKRTPADPTSAPVRPKEVPSGPSEPRKTSSREQFYVFKLLNSRKAAVTRIYICMYILFFSLYTYMYGYVYIHIS